MVGFQAHATACSSKGEERALHAVSYSCTLFLIHCTLSRPRVVTLSLQKVQLGEPVFAMLSRRKCESQVHLQQALKDESERVKKELVRTSDLPASES